ncbi:MAG TPA: hypothetical protein VF355_05450 [Anaerolineaceae bacterium]
MGSTIQEAGSISSPSSSTGSKEEAGRLFNRRSISIQQLVVMRGSQALKVLP